MELTVIAIIVLAVILGAGIGVVLGSKNCKLKKDVKPQLFDPNKMWWNDDEE